MSKLQVAAGRWMLLLGLPGWDGAWGNVAQGVEGGAASGVSRQGEARWVQVWQRRIAMRCEAGDMATW